jgi:hypothetical protein
MLIGIAHGRKIALQRGHERIAHRWPGLGVRFAVVQAQFAVDVPRSRRGAPQRIVADVVHLFLRGKTWRRHRGGVGAHLTEAGA